VAGAVAVPAVVRVDLDGFGADWAAAIAMASSSLLSSSSTGTTDLVDLLFTSAAFAAFIVFGSVFLVTRDFATIAFVRLVIGTGDAGAAAFRFGASSVDVLVVVSAARERVTRRGFAGLGTFRGAILADLLWQRGLFCCAP
jgi:hypothetical protein